MEENQKPAPKAQSKDPSIKDSPEQAPASAVSPKRNKKEKFSKKFLGVIALIALVLLLGLGGAYAKLGKSFMVKPNPHPTPELTSIPTNAPTTHPKSLLTPVPTKSTEVNNITPTKSVGQLLLFVNTNLNADHTISIKNATGFSTSQSGSGNVTNFYDIPEGTYDVTISQTPGRDIVTSSTCSDCTPSSASYTAGSGNYTVGVSAIKGHTNGVWFGFSSQ